MTLVDSKMGLCFSATMAEHGVQERRRRLSTMSCGRLVLLRLLGSFSLSLPWCLSRLRLRLRLLLCREERSLPLLPCRSLCLGAYKERGFSPQNNVNIP